MNAAKKFVPLLDRILVSKIKPETKTPSGILLPESTNLSSRLAKVLAVGAGKVTPQGEAIAPKIQVGDTVLIPEYGGMDIKLDGEKFSVYREDDIIGILKEN
ncbi:bifunctional GroES chaperonin superfamily/GroES chaperonin family/GroES-like superfamily/Chaperonin GroES [Babesia duncani]|uniref:Bifunctional GroES chaperonin superfamily/GroES chaperonin family/GroES-like superfamily/Chaperonin GroES n=1 Tax=Babesia duncani TaxID=323732 RepID=A0AAD9UPU8_9APIC|nr:bifunctional GroES chaperonin superfamily/GroES chaperonin family/GroES-like superfamily/Chaperonin GroES [Babesia duncani]